jgi:hypothetical protein
MSTTIHDVKITEEKITKNKDLDEIVKLMTKDGVEDPLSLLPVNPWHRVEFTLKNSHAGFANAIRRVLVEEMPTKCLSFDEKELSTDDEFVLSDVLTKNINLIPIMQEINIQDFDKYTIYLYKYNGTNDIIDVKASDIVIAKRDRADRADRIDHLEKPEKQVKGKGQRQSNNTDSTSEDTSEGTSSDTSDDEAPQHTRKSKKGGAPVSEGLPLDQLIPESNIILMRLRPGKFLKIKKLLFLEGFGYKEAHKFSLLDNVTYEILDMTPYDIFTEKGTRSMEYDPKEFKLSFTTCGNIQPDTVINTCHDQMVKRLNRIRSKIKEYVDSKSTSNYFYTEGVEIIISNDFTKLRFLGEYITLIYMVAQRTYLLDPTIKYCSATIDRFDNEIGIIKVKHPEHIPQILDAIDACVKDLGVVQSAIVKAWK